MLGMLLNNTLCCFNIVTKYNNIIDFIVGNSVICSIIIYNNSIIHKFCKWHRIVIISNFINIIIANVDIIFTLDINDKQLLSIYYIVNAIAALIILIINNDRIKRR